RFIPAGGDHRLECRHESGHLRLRSNRHAQPVVHWGKLSSHKNLPLLEVLGDRGHILPNVDHKEVSLRRDHLVTPATQIGDRLLTKLDRHLFDLLFVRRVTKSGDSAILHNGAYGAPAECTHSLNQFFWREPITETHAGEPGYL